MGSTERKAKGKEDLRSLILHSARTLFVEKGIEQTTIRSIADAIEYSVGTVYVYFRDKSAILHALHTQGFVELSGRFSVLVSVDNPMERLRAMGRVYIQFALENPDMYDLMFSVKAPMAFLSVMNEEWTEGKATFDILRTTVQQCINTGHFVGHEPEPLAFMVWSLVHGLCSLEISCRAQGVNLTNPDDIVNQAYDEFLKMMARE